MCYLDCLIEDLRVRSDMSNTESKPENDQQFDDNSAE